MATKAKMIEYILENSNEYTKKELEALKYKGVKEIFRITPSKEQNIEIIDELEKFITENDSLDLISSQDYGEDGVGLNSEEIDELIFDKEDKEFIHESLSNAQMRAYARTGKIPKKKVNKYTRFDNE